MHSVACRTCRFIQRSSPVTFKDSYMQVAVSKGHSAFDDQTKIEEQLAAFLLAEKLPVYLEFNSGSTGKIFGSGIMKQVGGRCAGKCPLR